MVWSGGRCRPTLESRGLLGPFVVTQLCLCLLSAFVVFVRLELQRAEPTVEPK